jgi:arginase
MEASRLRLIEVPYDSGHRDIRMGAGPLTLAGAGAAARLRERGHVVQEQVVEADAGWRSETVTAFELQRLVAEEAQDARRAGQIPLLLAGNCNTTLGLLAGRPEDSNRRRTGLIWLDAHGDFNTPETSPTGFLDGQALAMAVGRCWPAALAGLPGFIPLPEQDVILLGARSLDEQEEAALRTSAIAWLTPDQARDEEQIAAALADLSSRVDAVHLHIDLDVYDPSIAPANGYAAEGGLLAFEIDQIVRQIADRIPVTSAALASYDPGYDPCRRIRETALDLLTYVAALLQTPTAPAP